MTGGFEPQTGTFWQRYGRRITFSCIGVALGILFLTIGFWRTALLALLAGIGWWIGGHMGAGLWGRVKRAWDHITKNDNYLE